MQLVERLGAFRWGVLYDEDEIHIVPIDCDHQPLAPHTLSAGCACHPQLEMYARLMVTHNTVH